MLDHHLFSLCKPNPKNETKCFSRFCMDPVAFFIFFFSFFFDFKGKGERESKSGLGGGKLLKKKREKIILDRFTIKIYDFFFFLNRFRLFERTLG